MRVVEVPALAPWALPPKPGSRIAWEEKFRTVKSKKAPKQADGDRSQATRDLQTLRGIPLFPLLLPLPLPWEHRAAEPQLGRAEAANGEHATCREVSL